MPDDTDSQLMRRVKRGDVRAFEALVDRYRQPVMNLICRMVGDRHEAEDICQTTFLQVFRSAQRYREGAKFTTWLYTIARNLCLNEIRRRSRHRADSLDAERSDGSDQPQHVIVDGKAADAPTLLLQGELEAKIQEALSGLPENQRLAMLLYREKGLSYEEVSAIVGCSLSATKSLIFRARETLRQRLKPYLRTGQWSVDAE